MELSEFISKFADQFVDEDASAFTADTDFHELDSWSSLTSLSVVAMIIQEYGVELDSLDVLIQLKNYLKLLSLELNENHYF